MYHDYIIQCSKVHVVEVSKKFLNPVSLKPDQLQHALILEVIYVEQDEGSLFPRSTQLSIT